MEKPLIILPKKNNSGGNLEILLFVKSLDKLGYKTNSRYLFNQNQRFNNLKEIINLIKNWNSILKFSKRSQNIILTHYSTLFFALLFLHNKKLTIFIQCEEWKVISKFKYIQYISKLIHYIAYKKINTFIFSNKILIEAFKNDFLISKVINNKLVKVILYPVGNYSEKTEKIKEFNNRRYDISFLLRNNWVKRYDLYLETLKELYNLYPPETLKNIRIYIIDLSNKKFKIKSGIFNLNYSRELSNNEFKKILRDSKIFLYLSNYEGFGLPPLEALYEGCIPIITNNNGQYNYLRKNSNLILDKDSDAKKIANRIQNILSCSEKELIYDLKDLSEKAKRYYKYADHQRSKQIKKIIKILYKNN